MTPFQQFRLWMRRADMGQRARAAAAAVAVLALLVWLTIPTFLSASDPTSSLSFGNADPNVNPSAGPGGTSGDGGTSAGGAGATGTTTGAGVPGITGSQPGGQVSTGTSGGAGASGSTGPTRTPSTGPSSSCPAATSHGVTATTITGAVTLLDLGSDSGNAVLNVPSTSEQQSYWELVKNDVNARGGVGCGRRLALTYYKVPVSNANESQSQCLAIAASKPFFVMDTGALTATGAADCIPAQKIPLISAYSTADQLKKYYPYVLSPVDIADNTIRNGLLQLGKSGRLAKDPSFKKLGYVYHNCNAGLVRVGTKAIHDAGVKDADVVTFDLGCPSAVSSPSTIGQAILTFQQRGVTHITVVLTNPIDFVTFTKQAQSQQFKPKYVLAVEGAAASPPNRTSGPDPDQLNGAVNVDSASNADVHTPGAKKSPQTIACDKIFTSKGMKPTYEQPASYGGITCGYVTFVNSVLHRLTKLSGSALAPVVSTLGKVNYAYPYGIVDYGAAGRGAPYGRSYWRFETFSSDCACWKFISKSYQPPLS